MRILAIIGLPGSGKTLAAEFLEELGFKRFNLGDITREELKKQNLESTEANEKTIRDKLRKDEGMDAFAKRIAKKVETSSPKNIVLEDIISYEEVQYLKEKFKDKIRFVSIEAKENVRLNRLASRKVRPLTKEEVIQRDDHQLNSLNMKKSIESADYHLENNATIAAIKNDIINLLKREGF